MNDPDAHLASVDYDGSLWAATVAQDDVVHLHARGGWTPNLLESRPHPGPASPSPRRVHLNDVRLARPLTQVGRVFCVGHNYRAHIEEVGANIPAEPTIFAKFDSSLAGPRDPIPFTGPDSLMDWEAELVIVVGSGGRDLTIEQAATAIVGYTVGNDISQRQWQRRTGQWTLGKIADASTPIGPWIVPATVLGTDPDLSISCEVNGSRTQHSRTSDMVFKPTDLVAYLSHIVSLRPGDLIFTGTPGGVGIASGNSLAPGDRVTTSIERIGTLVNDIVAGC